MTANLPKDHPAILALQDQLESLADAQEFSEQGDLFEAEEAIDAAQAALDAAFLKRTQVRQHIETLKDAQAKIRDAIHLLGQ